MGSSGVWALIAGLFAIASGLFLGEAAYQQTQRRNAAAAMLLPTRREQIILRLKGGFRPFRRPAKWLLEIRALDNVAQDAVLLMEDGGLPFTKEALVSLLLALSMAVAFIGGIITASLVFGIALGCIVFFGVIAAVRNRTDKRNAHMREEIPEALRSMATCFRSGLSLLQSLQHTAKETGGGLGKIFSIAASRLSMGATPTEALAIMRGNRQLPELSFVAVALDVQHTSGGSIAPVLESAHDSVESELNLMRSLRVQTAQAKLSASIVTMMPFILVAFFSLMSPDFLTPFFSSFLGMVFLALAIVMQITGVLVVRHMLKIDME